MNFQQVEKVCINEFKELFATNEEFLCLDSGEVVEVIRV